MTVRGRSTTGR